MNSIVKKKFPELFKTISTEELLRIYHDGPEKLSYQVGNLEENILVASPIKNKWSIQEIVFHLLDAELVASVRIRLIVGGTDKALPYFDQDLWAEKMNYNSRSVDDLLDAVRLIYSLRTSNYSFFKTLSEADWAKEGAHFEFGNVSLRKLLEFYADHGERHLEQINERLKLLNIDREAEIELKQRLY